MMKRFLLFTLSLLLTFYSANSQSMGNVSWVYQSSNMLVYCTSNSGTNSAMEANRMVIRMGSNFTTANMPCSGND